MLGPDLLAAPVLDEGATERSAYLPRGRWVDVWRSAKFEQGRGRLRIGRAKQLKGGREVTVPAPLDELPLFARAGSVLPLLPPEVDTLFPTDGERPGLVTVKERKRDLELLAFPRGRENSHAFTGGRIRSLEVRGGWRLEVLGTRAKRFGVEAAFSTLRRPLRPCEVRVNGRVVNGRAWSYDSRTRVFRVHFEQANPRLNVRAC
jgi:alpha-D-xyloside xylohydrolase